MLSTTELAKNRDDDDQEQQQRHQEEEEEFLRKLEVIANSVHNCIGRLAAFEAKLSKAFASARSLTRKFVRSMAFTNSSGFSSYWCLQCFVLFYVNCFCKTGKSIGKLGDKNGILFTKLSKYSYTYSSKKYITRQR